MFDFDVIVNMFETGEFDHLYYGGEQERMMWAAILLLISGNPDTKYGC